MCIQEGRQLAVIKLSTQKQQQQQRFVFELITVLPLRHFSHQILEYHCTAALACGFLRPLRFRLSKHHRGPSEHFSNSSVQSVFFPPPSGYKQIFLWSKQMKKCFIASISQFF